MQPIHQSRKTKYIVSGIVGVIVVLWFNPLHIADVVRGTAQWALQPVVHVGYLIGTTARTGVELLTHIGSLYRDNQQLLTRVRELEAAQARADDCARDNTALRTELDLAQRRTFAADAANVIMRDTLGGRQWIMIDKGSQSGVTLGAPVVTRGDILIGRIGEVHASTARVDLLTHPSSVITIVGSRSGAQAIARGNHGLAMIVEDIPKDARVENGEPFVTSHLADRMPAGLAVGVIQNIAPSADSLFQTGILTPAIAPQDLTTVFVVR